MLAGAMGWRQEVANLLLHVFNSLRYRDAPCAIEDIPSVDICVISHDHYDHLDLGSVQRLAARFPAMQW
jgi:L-ascorbate metabolism protein UlaG (beta-lactamase superfamily)